MENVPEQEQENLTLLEHLDELRIRLIRSVMALGVGFLIGWVFRRDILYVLKAPLIKVLPEEMRHTILLKVIDKFFIDLKVAFIGGLFLASPVIIYQVWKFIAPGLYQNEKKMAIPLTFFGSFFFFLGVAFCYFFVLPYGFAFLVEYSTSSPTMLFDSLGEFAAPDKLEIALREHIGFTASIMFAFGLAFETPVFMFILSMGGVVDPAWFAKQRKYALLVIFIFAAILTPPDPWTQAALAVPLLLLYELGIRASQLMMLFKKKNNENDDTDDTDDTDKTD